MDFYFARSYEFKNQYFHTTNLTVFTILILNRDLYYIFLFYFRSGILIIHWNIQSRHTTQPSLSVAHVAAKATSSVVRRMTRL